MRNLYSLFFIALIAISCGGSISNPTNEGLVLKGTVDLSLLEKPTSRQKGERVNSFELHSLSGEVLQIISATSTTYTFSKITINTSYIVVAKLSTGAELEVLTDPITKNTTQNISIDTTTVLAVTRSQVGNDLSKVSNLKEIKSEVVVSVRQNTTVIIQTIKTRIFSIVKAGRKVEAENDLSTERLQEIEPTIKITDVDAVIKTPIQTKKLYIAGKGSRKLVIGSEFVFQLKTIGASSRKYEISTDQSKLNAQLNEYRVTLSPLKVGEVNMIVKDTVNNLSKTFTFFLKATDDNKVAIVQIPEKKDQNALFEDFSTMSDDLKNKFYTFYEGKIEKLSTVFSANLEGFNKKIYTQDGSIFLNTYNHPLLLPIDSIQTGLEIKFSGNLLLAGVKKGTTIRPYFFSAEKFSLFDSKTSNKITVSKDSIDPNGKKIDLTGYDFLLLGQNQLSPGQSSNDGLEYNQLPKIDYLKTIVISNDIDDNIGSNDAGEILIKGSVSGVKDFYNPTNGIRFTKGTLIDTGTKASADAKFYLFESDITVKGTLTIK